MLRNISVVDSFFVKRLPGIKVGSYLLKAFDNNIEKSLWKLSSACSTIISDQLRIIIVTHTDT